MFEVSIEAKEFIGLPRVKQHRLVTDSLKQEISEMHGIRIHTNPTPTEQVIAIKTSLQWVNFCRSVHLGFPRCVREERKHYISNLLGECTLIASFERLRSVNEIQKTGIFNWINYGTKVKRIFRPEDSSF
ncbi:hypothetical protein MSG28_012528 [Choristoneura fumiferana]|uniref:Uncharacterized protein n=1 Tax=Choristoneura fumiferana TaxID=7141 RepID=A0ACC0KDC3_CHOFU|nr:hypothetical protein MSG28_012528 [Choristoneura fumiferana]